MAAVALVPAAGKAERFGGDKLTAVIGGEPLINHTLRCLLEGGASQVVVVASHGNGLTDPDAGVTLAVDRRVAIVVNPDPDRGMFSSIQVALAAAPASADPLLVLPGDMPFVQASTVRRVINSVPTGQIVLPTCNGRHGHPIGIPGVLRSAILGAVATGTLKSALARCQVPYHELNIEDTGILRDVDRPGDLREDA